MAQLIHERAQSLHLPITSPAFAQTLDHADELKTFRHQFSLPHNPHHHHQQDSHQHGNSDSSTHSNGETPSSSPSEFIYLCANSLGLMPFRAREYLLRELDKWGQIGVEGWFRDDPWAKLDEKIAPLLANVVGAKPSEVVSMNALTLNLHLMMIAFYKPTETRFKIVVEDGLFCSDSHAIRSQLLLHKLDPDLALVKVVPRCFEKDPTLRTEDIVSVIREHGDSVAVVLLSGIQYYTGQFFDIPGITKVGHEVGAVVGWDLAHAVGNVVLKLHDWDVDFAAWCTYKYLSSGPGGVGGAFVHERHHHADRGKAGLNGLDGWWGQSFESKFRMGEVHEATVGAQGFQTSTVPVLSSVCLLASLEIFEEATMERISAKQRLLTGYLEALLKEDYLKTRIQILTPSEIGARGAQLSLKYDKAYPVKDVHKHLEALGVICDLREPDVMRIGPSSLYNSFADILRFVDLVQQALKSIEGERR